MPKGSAAAKNMTTTTKKKPSSSSSSSLRPFKDFHADWISTLRHSLLPLLRQSIAVSSSSSSSDILAISGGALVSSSDLLASHSSAVLSHFLNYSHALDLAARRDAAQLLSPRLWRSPLELPFLWIGDYYPSLFTNLFRSVSASNLRVDHVKRGIRLIAPAIASRFRESQVHLVGRIASEFRESLELSEEAVKHQLEDLESIFGDANRLRRSVLAEIVGASEDVHQGALFLEALADFVVGFWDQDLLHEFEQCNTRLLMSS